jgi:hypothetical protein
MPRVSTVKYFAKKLLIGNYLSFFDKKDLINIINGFIHYIMNSNEISLKANARLQRIKIVSRVVRYAFLALFIISIIYFLFGILFSSAPSWNFKNNVWRALCVVAMQVVICLWYWKLARLFGFYERGLIFVSEAVRCIKFLGWLCVAQWMLGTIYHILLKYYPIIPLQPTLPPGVSVTVKQAMIGRMGFFSFDIWGINFGFLLAGTVIVLIAWIMDEGRKIQEEQELTV